MKPYLKIIAFLLLNIPVCQAQNKSNKEKIVDLFTSCQKVYDGTNTFMLKVNYKLYSTYKMNTARESYNGVMMKKNRNYYSKIGNTEFISIDNNSIKIDNESKLVQVNQQKTPVSELYNLGNLLTNFDKFEITAEGNYWVCTMTTPKITFVPYSKVIIYIDKQNNTIAKQSLFMLTKTQYTDNNGKEVSDYPRLEITFNSFVTKNIDFGLKLSLENYIRKTNKKTTLSKNYKNYKLVD